MSKSFVYVSCAESKEIQFFLLDEETGGLSLVQSVPVDEGSPLPLRISPSQRVLYAGVRNENSIESFLIDSSGKLSFLNKVPAQGAPTYLACDRIEKLLFCASYGDNNLGVYSLDEQGKIKDLCQVEENLPRAHAALADHSNNKVIVPLLGADVIRVYQLDTELGISSLVPNDPEMIRCKEGAGPRHPLLGSDNRNLFCLNELDGTIDYYHFDHRIGALSIQQTISMMPPDFQGAPWAAEFKMTPDESFLYATDRRSSTIAAFAFNKETERLALIGHYATEPQPRGMDISPSGKWLIASGELSGQLVVYAIQANGTLKEAGHYVTGKDPICIEIMSGE